MRRLLFCAPDQRPGPEAMARAAVRRPTWRHRKARAAMLTVAGLAVISCWTAVQFVSPSPLLVINESRSLPRGLYRLAKAPVERGGIVAFTPPAAARVYLQGLGAPDDVRLLKRIVAVGGDLVCMRGGELTIPGRHFTVPAHDRRGRSLPLWQDCRRLEREEVFVLGDSDNSFDSRYFGPVLRSDTTGPYVEAISW